MLQISELDSFKMDRKMLDGTTKKSRRYVYSVSGSADMLASYKRDVANKTAKGGLITDAGDIRFYSWRKCIGGVGTIKRTSKGLWYIDTTSMDELESLAEQSPALMKALGESLLDRLMKGPTKQEDKPAPQDDDDDLEVPF